MSEVNLRPKWDKIRNKPDLVEASAMQAAPTKATPIDADGVILIDSAASNAIKRTLWSSLKDTLKTYFDTIYGSTVRSLPSGGTTGQALAKSTNDDYEVEWVTVSSGGGTWGSITGTLSSQTDLQTALNGKLASSVTKAELNAAVSDGDVYFVGDGINETIGATTRNTGAFTSVAVGTTTATTGAVRLANSEIITARNAANSANVDLLQLNASNVIQIGGATNAVSLNTFWQTNTSTGALNATSASYPLSFGNAAFLYGPSANTLEQYNSTNAQTFNVYGTRTDSSNYRRLRFGSTTAGAFSITAEGLGTGASGNTLTLSPITTTDINCTNEIVAPNVRRDSSYNYFLINSAGLKLGSTSAIQGFPTISTLGTQDVTFSRFGVGEWQCGTTANNALGSLRLTNLTASGTVTVGSGTPIARVLSATATLDFGSIAANSFADLTITVTNAAVGDTVSLGVPNGSILSDLAFFGWVSATNTVTVRCLNDSATTARDPASGTFRATVTQF